MVNSKMKQLEKEKDVKEIIENNENVMICCGRIGPMCLPVYAIMEGLVEKYTHVIFGKQDFDIPEALYIRSLPECVSFMSLPFTIYFKNGKVVKATSGIQRTREVVEILDNEFGNG